MVDFHQKQELGQTGLLASRLGIGSSFGTPTRVIEEAFDHGVNYLYWGTIRRPAFGRAMRNLARRHREELVLTIQSYSRLPALIGPSIDVALLRSRVEYFDILLLGGRNERPGNAYIEAFERLREKGKVRFLGLSTHNRPLLPTLVNENREKKSPFDVAMLRYNAVHRGAEKDVFPLLPSERPPGVIAFTATRWGHLLDPTKMPEGDTTPSASDCYRFALSHPAVDVVLCGPSDRTQMQEALRTLERGPLDAEEMERMRRIGDHIYHRHKPQFPDMGDEGDS
jgi:predicted aldo/keto reductase-like oxidoreductase